MSLDILKLRRSCGDGTDDESLVKAVWEIDKSVESPDQAKAFLYFLAKCLLEKEKYGSAGLLLWGPELFNNGPRAVQQLIHKIRTTQNLIVLGGAALGKTYTCVAMLLLDWIRDPEYTETKIISTSGGHAKANAFSTLQRLYAASIVPLPGVCMSEFIGLDVKNRHTGISLVAIPQGDINEGRAVLQGFHPIPRKQKHPVFGSSSRVRCFIDEAEEAPAGVFTGVSNLLASGFGVEHVKVICATNPRDVTSKLSQMAEPEKSWSLVDLEQDTEWVSREGNWSVIRLDGASAENVVSREVVFPGFLTWQGYQQFALEMGGQSPKYLTFGRGMYPLQSMQTTLIDFSLLQINIGQFIFSGRTIGAGGLDLASESGSDRVILFTGRYGRAIGFQPLNGKPTLFQKPRYCVGVDQWFEIAKIKTIALASEIEAKCKGLNIHPDWLTVDRTGMGVGCHDALCEQWSGSIRGVMWGAEAGNRKILADDHNFCAELYADLACEMWVRIRKYLEFNLMAFSPQIQTSGLFKELSSRRYAPAPKGVSGFPRIRLEPKKEFKKRLGWSPDIADALVMMVHGCALNGPEKASMIGGSKTPRFGPGDNIGPREKNDYIDFSQDF